MTTDMAQIDTPNYILPAEDGLKMIHIHRKDIG